MQPLQPWPEVRYGDNGHPVKTLQRLLRARGESRAPMVGSGPSRVRPSSACNRRPAWWSTASSGPTPGAPSSAACSRCDPNGPAPAGLQRRYGALAGSFAGYRSYAKKKNNGLGYQRSVGTSLASPVRAALVGLGTPNGTAFIDAITR